MHEAKKYFGTDGIRGRFGGEIINTEFMYKLGWAAGQVLGSPDARVVIGKDTRESGDELEAALVYGLAASNVVSQSCGVIPTPAVAYLTNTLSACAGIMISASHNPYQDNGIKFFDAQGRKLSDDMELAIEALLADAPARPTSQVEQEVQCIDDASHRYIELCKASASNDLLLSGLKLVVDCANGAAHQIAPQLLVDMGAEVHSIGIQPNGRNINLNCGATDLQALQATVVEQQADLGIALDGDADRLMMVDNTGAVVDGDEIIYIIARSKIRTGTMKGPVVGTLMSNLGLQQAIEQLGLEFIREAVGDRHVLQRLHAEDGVLGGESSGHIICLDKASTGDGLVAALQVLNAMHAENCSLLEIRSGMSKFPQVMINVPISDRPSADILARMNSHIIDAENQLAANGRVLLRASGTEPLIRVMVEGRDLAQIEEKAEYLAGQVRKYAKN